jgi:hypothetical protein
MIDALRSLFDWFDVDTCFEGARHALLDGRALSLALRGSWGSSRETK